MIRSAVATLRAIGTFQTVTIRSTASTSGSCSGGSSGFQKKTSMSMGALGDPGLICWSPPIGPDRNRVTGRPSPYSIIVRWVPVT